MGTDKVPRFPAARNMVNVPFVPAVFSFKSLLHLKNALRVLLKSNLERGILAGAICFDILRVEMVSSGSKFLP